MQMQASWLSGAAGSSLLAPLLGGALIGLAAALLWLFNGRVAGVSGVAGGLLRTTRGDRLWRALFVLGLCLGGLFAGRALPAAFEAAGSAPLTLLVAGALVGVGTKLGNGCTSGHGVCGLSRLSRRSLAATLTFMATGVLTVFVIRHALGAAP
jgi:uncharacterized membrane protein YedE/YeeE